MQIHPHTYARAHIPALVNKQTHIWMRGRSEGTHIHTNTHDHRQYTDNMSLWVNDFTLNYIFQLNNVLFKKNSNANYRDDNLIC